MKNHDSVRDHVNNSLIASKISLANNTSCISVNKIEQACGNFSSTMVDSFCLIMINLGLFRCRRQFLQYVQRKQKHYINFIFNNPVKGGCNMYLKLTATYFPSPFIPFCAFYPQDLRSRPIYPGRFLLLDNAKFFRDESNMIFEQFYHSPGIRIS